MSLGHQVETTEMSDAGLDGICGGLAVGGSGGLFLGTPLADLCGGITVVGTEHGLSSDTGLHVASH